MSGLTSEETRARDGFTTTWVSRTSPLCCRVRCPADENETSREREREREKKQKRREQGREKREEIIIIAADDVDSYVTFGHLDKG